MRAIYVLSMVVVLIALLSCAIDDRYESEVDKDARWGDAEARANQNMGYREAPSTGMQFPDTLKALPVVNLKEKYEQLYQQGLSYAKGEGVPEDASKAFKCFLEAAEVGRHANAAYELAKCYKSGKGTKKNLEEAYYWMNMSAMLGNQEAERETIAMKGYLSDKAQARVMARIQEMESNLSQP